MALKLKDLVAGQQRLQQQDEAPVRLNPEQFKGLVEALSGGATSAGSKSSAQIFEEFVAQTRKREELLKDATEEQKAIFKELEDTLKKQQSASHTDSQALRKSIEGLNRRLAATPNTAAKSRMLNMMPAAPAAATTRNTFAPTLTPENYAIAENASTVGNAEVKTKGEGGGIGAALQGIGTAIGGIAEGIGRAIDGLGRVLSSAIQGLVGIFTGKSVVDALGRGGDLPDVVTGGEEKQKGKGKGKGPTAKPSMKDRIKGNLKRGGKLGIAGIATSLIGNIAADQLTRSGHEDAGAAVGVGTDILGYAGTGAMLGSIFGPVGTAIGAGAGAVYGGIEGLRNRTNILDKGGVFDGGAIQTKNPMNQELPELQAAHSDLLSSIHTGGTVINNISAPPNAAALASGPVFAPGPSIRPNESAYEKYQNRIFSM